SWHRTGARANRRSAGNAAGPPWPRRSHAFHRRTAWIPSCAVAYQVKSKPHANGSSDVSVQAIVTQRTANEQPLHATVHEGAQRLLAVRGGAFAGAAGRQRLPLRGARIVEICALAV